MKMRFTYEVRTACVNWAEIGQSMQRIVITLSTWFAWYQHVDAGCNQLPCTFSQSMPSMASTPEGSGMTKESGRVALFTDPNVRGDFVL